MEIVENWKNKGIKKEDFEKIEKDGQNYVDNAIEKQGFCKVCDLRGYIYKKYGISF